jgi:NADH-quinone oxidoreductase subunit F
VATDPLVFAGTDAGPVTSLADYERDGGFASLRKARAMQPDDVITLVQEADLRGRGGAGFPTGVKWSLIPKPDQLPRPHYLVVNADESEPGSFKDHEIMERIPFRFLEGCLISAHAIAAKVVLVYIRGEYDGPYAVLAGALEELERRPELMGDVTIILHRGAGAYICGEETALLESLEGKRGQPRTKPPFPAVAGAYASPTAVNNVESIATVTSIVELGAAGFASIGVKSSTGTRVFSVSGNVAKPGNYEIEGGLPLRSLIYDLAGGIPSGRALKAVVPGGLSAPLLTADEIDVGLDIDSLRAAGTGVGSAGVIVMDDKTCIVEFALRSSQFYEHESCGKCTPCREGTRWLTQILEKLEDGRASQADLDLLLDVCDRINGKCLCPLGDSDALVVATCVAKFRDEFQAHIDGGGCPLGDESNLEGILAPVAQHVHSSSVKWLATVDG